MKIPVSSFISNKEPASPVIGKAGFFVRLVEPPHPPEPHGINTPVPVHEDAPPSILILPL